MQRLDKIKSFSFISSHGSQLSRRGPAWGSRYITAEQYDKVIRNKLDFKSAVEIAFAPGKKKFGLDWHLWQFFVCCCVPPLAVVMVGKWAIRDKKKFDAVTYLLESSFRLLKKTLHIQLRYEKIRKAKAAAEEPRLKAESEIHMFLNELKSRLDKIEETLMNLTTTYSGSKGSKDTNSEMDSAKQTDDQKPASVEQPNHKENEPAAKKPNRASSSDKAPKETNSKADTGDKNVLPDNINEKSDLNGKDSENVGPSANHGSQVQRPQAGSTTETNHQRPASGS